MELYAHQKKLVDLNPDRHLIAFDTGTGKTFTALSLAEKNKTVCLIIVPKHLVASWQRAIQSFTLPHRIITKETFRRDWQKIGCYKGVIVDEAHNFFGYNSQMHHSLCKYLKDYQVNFRLFLTATPVTATPYSVFACARLMGYDWNWYSFTTKFFYKIKMGHRMVTKVRENMRGQLIDLVKQMGTIVKIEDCIDMPEQVHERIDFDLTKDQAKAIKEIAEPVHIVRWTKMHQLENGTIKGDEYINDMFYDSLKSDYIVSLAGEHRKMAVFARYNLQLDLYKEKLESAGYTVFMIRGDVKNRDEIVQEVEKSDDCVVLINASCSTGYELPSVGMIVFASLSFSYLDYSQACGRFLRINKPKRNVYLHLVTKGGVDEGVYESISEKKDFYIEMFGRDRV